MKILITIFLLLLTACASNHQQAAAPLSLKKFQKIPLGSDVAELKKWNESTSDELISIEGQSFISKEFRENNKAIALFTIDPSTSKTVEKIYFPSMHLPEANLQSLMANEFKNVRFSELRPKCRHNNDLVFQERNQGLSILSAKEQSAKVVAISYATPQIFELRIKENLNRKCK